MANKYWVGASSGLWNVSGNWSASSGGAGGAGVPSAADIAYFDSGYTGTRDCTVNATISILGLRIQATYDGTLDHVTYNSTIGGSGTIISDAGGGAWDIGSGTCSTVSAVTVTGNPITGTGWFKFYQTAGNRAFTITGTFSIPNAWFGQGSDKALTPTIVGTMTITGDLKFDGNNPSATVNFIGGTIAVEGDVLIQDAYAYTGTTIILINGTGDQEINSNGVVHTNNIMAVTINKPSGTLTLIGTITTSKNWILTAGIVDYGTSTVSFWLPAGTAANSILGSPTFYNLMFGSQGSGKNLTTTITGTVTVENTLTLDNGFGGSNVNTGAINVEGNVDVNAGGTHGGSSVLTFTGTNAQIFDLTGATNILNRSVVVNKASEIVTLASVLTMDQGGQDLTITSGSLDIDGNTLTVAGTLTVVDGFIWNGDETLALGVQDFQATCSVTYKAPSGTPTIDDIAQVFAELTLAAGNYEVTSGGGNGLTVGILTFTGGEWSTFIDSDTPGTQWELDLTGSAVIGYRGTINDSDASAGVLVEAVGSQNRGNNDNWNFGTRSCSKFIVMCLDMSNVNPTDLSCQGFSGTGIGLDATNIVDGVAGGKCLEFNGSNEYVNLGDTEILDGAVEFTLSTWIIVPTQVEAAAANILSKYSSNGDNQAFNLVYFVGTGHIRIAVWDGANANSDFQETDAAIPLNQWVHIVTTWVGNPKNLDIYINGEEVASTYTPAGTPPVVFPAVNSKYFIAAAEDVVTAPDFFFTGPVDQTRMYNIALLPVQVLELYSRQFQGKIG